MSARAVVVAGGTGFEKMTWFEVMSQKTDVMQYLSGLLFSGGAAKVDWRQKLKHIHRPAPMDESQAWPLKSPINLDQSDEDRQAASG